MSIIDQLLGNNGSQQSGSISESDNSSSVHASPGLVFGTGQVLGFDTADANSDGSNGDHSGSASSLSVLDGVGLGISAPVGADFHNSSASADYSDQGSSGGGLLGGLL